MRIKKRYYKEINTINVKKHLKEIQAEADATCEKSILNKCNVLSKEITM